MMRGRLLLVCSVLSRGAVVLLLANMALWCQYINYKVGYNHPRLVELSSGKPARYFYEYSDWLFSLLGDPLVAAQSTGGMTWSIRLLGFPVTDPVAALSLAFSGSGWTWGFALGLLLPLGLALSLGRVFCSWVCPASLLFFTVARIRRLLGRFFLFPDLVPPRSLAWGLLLGGLVSAAFIGHGLWTLLLPYFAVGQSLFHGLAFGTLSISLMALLVFALADLLLGRQFTCRHLCPTGRLLGWVGQRALVGIVKDEPRCVDGCSACNDVCPYDARPREGARRDCSLCGECLIVCPTTCLDIGRSGS